MLQHVISDDSDLITDNLKENVIENELYLKDASHFDMQINDSGLQTLKSSLTSRKNTMILASATSPVQQLEVDLQSIQAKNTIYESSTDKNRNSSYQKQKE